LIMDAIYDRCRQDFLAHPRRNDSPGQPCPSHSGWLDEARGIYLLANANAWLAVYEVGSIRRLDRWRELAECLNANERHTRSR
jgi:hypothetical protein